LYWSPKQSSKACHDAFTKVQSLFHEVFARSKAFFIHEVFAKSKVFHSWSFCKDLQSFFFSVLELTLQRKVLKS
jgi:hypothetical protein